MHSYNGTLSHIYPHRNSLGNLKHESNVCEQFDISSSDSYISGHEKSTQPTILTGGFRCRTIFYFFIFFKRCRTSENVGTVMNLTYIYHTLIYAGQVLLLFIPCIQFWQQHISFTIDSLQMFIMGSPYQHYFTYLFFPIILYNNLPLTSSTVQLANTTPDSALTQHQGFAENVPNIASEGFLQKGPGISLSSKLFAIYFTGVFGSLHARQLYVLLLTVASPTSPVQMIPFLSPYIYLSSEMEFSQ